MEGDSPRTEEGNGMGKVPLLDQEEGGQPVLRVAREIRPTVG